MKTNIKYFIVLVALLLSFSGLTELTYGQRKKAPPSAPPKPVENPFKQAEVLYLKKDYAKAMEIFQKIYSEYPDSIDVVYYIGNIYLKTGEYEKGKEALWKATLAKEKYKDCVFKIDYGSIPLALIRPNLDGDELISKIANGIRVSGLMYQEDASAKILNEVSYPVWSEAGREVGSGIEIGGFYSPYSFSVSYLSGEIDLKTVRRKFALPPGIPDDVTGFDYKVNVTSLNFTAEYTPAVLFWGYVYPSVGGFFLMSNFKHGSVKKNYNAIGASAEVMLKYKNLFVKGGFKKGIDNKTIDNQFTLQFGFKINMFN